MGEKRHIYGHQVTDRALPPVQPERSCVGRQRQVPVDTSNGGAMMELPEFGSVLSCMKCGYVPVDGSHGQLRKGFEAEYKRLDSAGQPIILEMERMLASQHREPDLKNIPDEWLERTCPRCQYSWMEATLDAKKENDAEIPPPPERPKPIPLKEGEQPPPRNPI